MALHESEPRRIAVSRLIAVLILPALSFMSAACSSSAPQESAGDAVATNQSPAAIESGPHDSTETEPTPDSKTLETNHGMPESQDGGETVAEKPVTGKQVADEPVPANDTPAVPEANPKNPDEQKDVVTGEVVLESDGTPVAGARVLLRSNALLETTTDDSGRFRIAGASSDWYWAWAETAKLVSPKQLLRRNPAGPTAREGYPRVRLMLGPGRELKITVTSGVTGKPLDGAVARLGYPDQAKATTGKDGLAVFPALRFDKYEVWIEAVGHARARDEFDLSGSGDLPTPKFTLAAGGTVRGIVKDESGQPLRGAHIVYFTAGVPYGYHGETSLTNEKGEFFDRYLPLNTTTAISADLKEYLGVRKDLALTDGQREQQIEIILNRRLRGGSVAGVVKGVDDKPLAGATVVNFGKQHDDKRETKTDNQGRFILHDLFTGYAGDEIFVMAPGFAPANAKIESGPADSPPEVTITLAAGHKIHGRVENKSGMPLAGAVVSAQSAQYPWQRTPSVRTGADGKFEFDSLPEGVAFRVSAEDYSDNDQTVLTLDGDEPVAVVLQSTGVVRGTVVDSESSQPVTRFRILKGLDFGNHAHFDPNGEAIQSRDGSFTIKKLDLGKTYSLRVEAEGYLRTIESEVPALETDLAEPVRISLTKRDRSKLAAVAGKVVDHAEQPMAGVQIRLIVSNIVPQPANANWFNWQLIEIGQLEQKSYVDQYLLTTTDEKGEFKFEDLVPDRYLQIAYWGDKAPKGRWLNLDQTEPGTAQSTTITVPEPAAIQGSFDAKSFPGVDEIQLVHSEENFLTYRAKPAAGKSEFKFENLPPGRYLLMLMAIPERINGPLGGFTTRPLTSTKLTIEPGDVLQVELTDDDRVK
jgi:hypothetical protein